MIFQLLWSCLPVLFCFLYHLRWYNLSANTIKDDLLNLTFQSGYGDQSSKGRASRMHAGSTFGSSTNGQRFVTRPLQAAAYITPGNCTFKWRKTQLIRSDHFFLLTCSAPCKPLFKNVVKTLLGLNSPNRRALTANHTATGRCSRQSQPGQRAESSSSSFSNGWVDNNLTQHVSSVQQSDTL